jgi:hypothetical protein
MVAWTANTVADLRVLDFLVGILCGYLRQSDGR